jgi:2-C-methyl-D-erythritol 4-phosphate cytidylyltransferase/2-C-methyl-D-erythritol 2,4-cyclodiphosphate synthase
VHVTAIVAAGGRGRRFGGARPKQLEIVGGRSILERSVALFISHPAVDEVVVALPDELLTHPPGYLKAGGKPLKLVAGGARRQDSVANAFKAASRASDVIVIHDAARPFASADLVGRIIDAARESGAAVAAVRASDTVKRAAEGPVVAETLPRDAIFLAQTPQAFRRGVLEAALAAGRDELEATDEAALAERAGQPVRIVEGERTNIKITTSDDLAIADAIARGNGRAAPAPRVGFGYDLHRLVEGRRLVLGGVVIPFERGLLGHSDADAVCHAIIEAIFGAAAAGDIGRHFPNADPQWKDASSLDLLRRAAEIAGARGFTVGNIDVSIVAERPKLAPHVDTMRANVAAALGIDVDRISIKGKTNEGVGALGRGEAIAAHAVVVLERF